MRRILSVLSAAALMAAMMAVSSVSAFAEPVCTENPPTQGTMGHWTVVCVEDVVVTEEVREPTTQSCEVGNSGKPGTQEGELVETYDVTQRTTTTRYFRGHPSNGNEDTTLMTQETVELGRVLVSSEFDPTRGCMPAHAGPPPR